jgi:pantothenate kinase
MMDLAERLATLRPKGKRLMVAIAGAPGSGKSTLAADLASQFEGGAVVPMDGFHLDNAVLEAGGLLPRKGAPETYDAAGFAAIMHRLATEDSVAIPLFDRSRDLSIAGAAVIEAHHRILLVEGNYLLLDRAPWSDLTPLWDVTVWLDVPLPMLEARLVQRWLDHGLTPDAAKARALSNDIPNARLVCTASRAPDLTIQSA